jgi:hypothetical protein
VLAAGNKLLAEINMDLIRSLCAAMGMRPAFYRSTELGIEGMRSERLVAFCRHFGASTYLSPLGSREYIESDGVFAASDVKVLYQDFVPPPYPQRGAAEYVSHLSLVDLLANVGFEEGKSYVEQTRYSGAGSH